MANFFKKLFGKSGSETAKEEKSSKTTTDSTPTVESTSTEAKNKSKVQELLPSFAIMDNEPSAEEIVRVAALSETILNLTFKNPFPIEQDPVFMAVFEANKQSIMECLETGKLNVGAHEELKQAYESKYPERVAKEMVDLDYWNMRMIEHVVLMKSLGPKPAYNCLHAAYNLLDFASEPCCILIINYAHLLLKFSMLKMANPVAVGDIKMALKQASTFLGFEEGINYCSSNQSTSSDNPLMGFISQINATKRNF